MNNYQAIWIGFGRLSKSHEKDSIEFLKSHYCIDWTVNHAQNKLSRKWFPGLPSKFTYWKLLAGSILFSLLVFKMLKCFMLSLFETWIFNFYSSSILSALKNVHTCIYLWFVIYYFTFSVQKTSDTCCWSGWGSKQGASTIRDRDMWSSLLLSK